MIRENSVKNKFYDVTKNGDGVFSTRSGKLIDILHPTADMISINDIATGLSNVCRFGGQINGFYSVAQHSVLVSHICKPEYALYGLMHDASEAYIGDVIKPLKNILGTVYEDIEAKFTHAICQKYNLDPELLNNIGVADKFALEMEHDFLRDIDSTVFEETSLHHGYEVGCWDQEDSYARFIDRFLDLI